ncbi:lysylphosphatidylglycerol synthase transmembrane domain-containing protein [Rubrivirga litoralis]|uniref:Lysylphosphatidylglycerol synthase transmembrane domain-containing protein n=1 Tax=Rubrivirga litoralis TaxID=3075598 RepID=A0ABU3BNN8_9BACT|nr:lysylphosphatidylglycerol synthase transmembrane domain-containing protein [Rubrivirga sp. F394]MDT0630878.1 lysylphosphatidylglycerol synthase transmembrane domain-containing protein [Rubrivirga sp. F394]
MDAASPLPAPARRVRKRDLVLPVALSLSALAVVLWLTYEPGTFSAVRDTFNPWILLGAVGALGVQITSGGLRLRHVSGGALSVPGGLRSQVTWDFMSAVTPSALGGAPFAAFFIARENKVPYGEITAVMLFAMLMDQIWFALLIVVLYLSAIWVPVFPTGLGAAGIGTVAAYLGGMLIYIAFFAYATLFRPELIERLANWVVHFRWLRRFEPTVQREARRLRRQARVLRSKPAAFYLKGAAYTAFYWAGRYGIVFLVALSFWRDFRHVLFVLRTAGMWLAGLAMPTPGGSGGIEALYVFYLAPLLPPGYGGPALLTWRLLTYYLILVLGFFVAGSAVRSLLAGERPPTEPPSGDGQPEAVPLVTPLTEPSAGVPPAR